MMTELDIEESEFMWLCGYLEGEACFSGHRNKGERHYCRIQVGTSDRDVLVRIVALLGGNITGPDVRRSERHSLIYRWNLYGERAMPIMEAIYSQMSARRKAQIDESFEKYWATRGR